MNKDDIELLKNIKKHIVDGVGLLWDDGDTAALDRIIAHLDQPYQQGEMIEVSDSEDFQGSATCKVRFVTMDGERAICELRDVGLYGWTYHRPIKQTVQVTLDKELVERTKKYYEYIKAKGRPVADQLAHDLCVAIASQEYVRTYLDTRTEKP